jgi:hypothetical protein
VAYIKKNSTSAEITSVTVTEQFQVFLLLVRKSAVGTVMSLLFVSFPSHCLMNKIGFWVLTTLFVEVFPTF